MKPSPRTKRMKWIASFIPVLGVALLMVRGELRSEHATKYLVPITGYDPRDLIHGQYLRFRFDWSSKVGVCESATCCYCFEGTPPQEPEAKLMSCAAAQSCRAYARQEEIEGEQRYLVPEYAGPPLDDAMREFSASVELQCSSDGGVAFGELYFDGLPWREAVGF